MDQKGINRREREREEEEIMNRITESKISTDYYLLHLSFIPMG